jgi:GxxExxY protein
MDKDVNALAGEVIGAAIEVHRALGPGLLESAYQAALEHELSLRGLRWVAEMPITASYKGRTLECAYRLDLFVEDCLVVELKSVTELLPIHKAQLLTYLRLTGQSLGLLINFNVSVLHKGICRVVLNLDPLRDLRVSASSALRDEG